MDPIRDNIEGDGGVPDLDRDNFFFVGLFVRLLLLAFGLCFCGDKDDDPVNGGAILSGSSESLLFVLTAIPLWMIVFVFVPVLMVLFFFFSPSVNVLVLIDFVFLGLPVREVGVPLLDGVRFFVDNDRSLSIRIVLVGDDIDLERRDGDAEPEGFRSNGLYFVYLSES